MALLPCTAVPLEWLRDPFVTDKEAAALAERDGGGGADDDLHVSLTSPSEKHALDTVTDLTAATAALPTTVGLVSLGVGCVQGSKFVVVLSADGDRLRAQLNLPPKDFHATLGFHTRDAHGKGARKDTGALMDAFTVGPLAAEAIVRVGVMNSPATAKTTRALRELVSRAQLARPLRGTVRIACALAEALYNSGQKQEALHALEWDDGQDHLLVSAHAAAAVGQDPSALWVLWDTRLALRAKLGLCTPTYVLDQVLPSVLGQPPQLEPPAARARVLRRVNAVLVRQPAEAQSVVLGVTAEGAVAKLPLPRNFSRVDDTVCASAAVGVEYLPALAALGVTDVVNLIAECTPLPHFVAQALALGIAVHHEPVQDRDAPSLPQLERVLALLVPDKRSPGPARRRVLVHCLGGVGRTGCVLAAHLMATGTPVPLAPEAALRLLESQRKTILTAPQRALLSAWYGVLAAKLGATSLPMPGGGARPATRDDAPDVIVLCGLPGSGKSTLVQTLLRVMHASTAGPCNLHVTSVQQDEDGKAAYAAFLAGWFADARRTPTQCRHAVLDRCNLKAADRAEAVAFATRHRLAVECVVMDTPVDTCIARIAGRSDHPVIKAAASGPRIVRDMAPLLQPPSTTEGFGAVVHVASEADVWALLDKWFGCGLQALDGEAVTASDAHSHGAPPKKFPRTRHLTNLGAATRDDLVLDAKEAAAFLAGPVLVQEKVDGANVGISIVDGQLAVQNRSHYVTTETGELFRPLGPWLEAHAADLWRIFETLPHGIVYGEWLHLAHAIHYTRLPDRFLVFDILDGATDTFLDSARVDALLHGTALTRTPTLFRGTTSLQALCTLASSAPSAFYDGVVEGVYVRTEAGGVVTGRAKIVRKDFLHAYDDHPVTHWTKGKTVRNTLAF